MKKTLVAARQLPLATCGLFLAIGGRAEAVLSIANGDFENNAPASNVMDVDSWFDANEEGQSAAAWWQSTWYGPTVSPNGTSVMGLSWAGSHSHWAYQSIGVNDGAATTLDLQFDVGSFTDAPGPRDIGITVAVYQSDGSFVPADDTDIDGASGISLIGGSAATHLLGAGETATKSVSIDISSANGTGELFLRFANFDNGDGDPWAAVDNVSIVPEPSIFALSGFGLAALLLRRRVRA